VLKTDNTTKGFWIVLYYILTTPHLYINVKGFWILTFIYKCGVVKI
jgi:hypothetical protein